MKLKLINYNVGPSKADNEFVWVDSENDDKEFSPIFTDEETEKYEFHSYGYHSYEKWYNY